MANNPTNSPQTETNLPVAMIWTDTQSKLFKFYHKWTIHNFSYQCQKDVGESLISAKFSSGINGDIKWNLQLYRSGQKEEMKDYLSLFLCLQSDNVTANAKYDLSIFDAKGKKRNNLKGQYRFLKMTGHGPLLFVKRDLVLDKSNELLLDNTLTLICEGSFTTDTVTTLGTSNAVQLKIPESRIVDDLEFLLESQKFSDVLLNVCGTEFHAHKAILSARSSVFCAMFEHDMEEQKRSQVDIIDIDPEVFKEVLRFIYTDRTTKLEDLAWTLIAVADKYALHRLMVMCKAALFASLSIENSSDILILADLHNVGELKSQTADFINEHRKDVLNTTSFKLMLQSHPHLVAELLQKLMMS